MMKTNLYPIIAASIVMAASCAKEPVVLCDYGTQIALQAEVEQPYDGSKTSLGAGNIVLWDAGDAISVLSQGHNDKFTVKSLGTPATQAKFAGTLSQASQYYALYPYQAEASFADEALHFSVAQSRKYVAGSFADDAFVSVASFTDPSKNLSFKNVFGLFKLSLTGSVTVNKIALVDESAAMLWGDCALKTDSNIGTGLQNLSFADGNNMIFLTDVNVTLSSTPTDFFFVVPAGSLKEGFTVYVYDSAGVASILSTKKDNSILRSTILKMPAVEAVAISDYDLSGRATANCYMVPAKGGYTFSATKGQDGESVTPAKVAVLWESNGTTTAPAKGSIVSGCSVSGSTISITATGTKGNAVIAAYDGSDQIVWSWHIWCPGEPFATKKYTSGTGAYIMDRNVGALSITPGDYLCAGIVCQVGRKDPFPGAGAVGTASGVKTIAVANPDIKLTAQSATTGTYAYVNAHPNEYINSAAKWNSSPDMTAWAKSDGSKGVYDPCPAGYMLLTKDDITGLAHGKYDTSKLGMLVDNTEWYQFTAGRDATTGVGKNIGKYLYLDTSTINADFTGYYLFGNTSSTLEPRTSANLASASSIRCKKIK